MPTEYDEIVALLEIIKNGIQEQDKHTKIRISHSPASIGPMLLIQSNRYITVRISGNKVHIFNTYRNLNRVILELQSPTLFDDIIAAIKVA